LPTARLLVGFAATLTRLCLLKRRCTSLNLILVSENLSAEGAMDSTDTVRAGYVWFTGLTMRIAR